MGLLSQTLRQHQRTFCGNIGISRLSVVLIMTIAPSVRNPNLFAEIRLGKDSLSLYCIGRLPPNFSIFSKASS
ncbi:MAG: hypothetical protein WBN06_02625, partial [Lysobacterales bacterium]